MRFKSTLFGALALLALAAFVFLYEIRGGEKRQQAVQQAKKVLPVDEDQITGLTLKGPQEAIVCQRTDEGWQIILPLRTSADDDAIADLIAAVERAQVERVVSEGEEDLAQFGLETPQATLELTLASSPAQIIHLGYGNPVGSHIYARRQGDGRVFLTHSGLLTQCQKKVFDLRDKRVLSFSEADVRSLTLSGKHGTIQARRSEDGWMLEKPLHVKADKISIEGILRKLQTARVSSFVEEHPEDLWPYGLVQPELTITLSLDPQGALHQLLIGTQKEDQRYARDDSKDPVFLIAETLLEEVDQTPFDLRDKRVLDFDRNRVTQLELLSPERTIICQRDTSGRWQLTAPESAAAKKWELDNIVSLLSTLKAESFVDERPADLWPYGLASPHLQAMLRENSKQLAALRIGAGKGDQVYACDASGAPVSLVNSDIVKALSIAVADLQEEKAPMP